MFVNGQVSWETIGLSTAGVYHLRFHASGTLSGYKFNISSQVAILEVLPSGRPASLHILQQPGNAAPVHLLACTCNLATTTHSYTHSLTHMCPLTRKHTHMYVDIGIETQHIQDISLGHVLMSQPQIISTDIWGCLQRYSSPNMTGKDVFMLQRSPILQLRDSANNPIIGFRGTFEVRSTGGDFSTQLGVGDKMSFYAGGTRVQLPGIFFTTQAQRDANLYLLFRSSCCSLLSQVSDDLRSSNLSLSGASTGIRVTVQGHINGSIIRAGEPFSIIATAIAADGETAFGFSETVVLDDTLTARGPSGLLTVLQSGALEARAQNGVAQFDLVMRQVRTFESTLVIGYPLGYFVSELHSGTSKFISIVGAPSSVSIVQQPSSATGGLALVLQPVLQVVDKAGNAAIPIAGATLTAVLHRASGSVLGSSNGKLLGTVTVQCSTTTGRCAFINIAIDKTGRYFLSFSSSSTASADGINADGVFSHIFEVLIGSIATVSSIQTPAQSTGGIQFAIQPVSAVTDAGGNWVYQTSKRIQLAACCNCGTPSATACSLNGE